MPLGGGDFSFRLESFEAEEEEEEEGASFFSFFLKKGSIAAVCVCVSEGVFSLVFFLSSSKHDVTNTKISFDVQMFSSNGEVVLSFHFRFV